MSTKTYKELQKKVNNPDLVKNQQANLDVIDQIELKLKQLEQEKNEIENLYGIDENTLNNYISIQENIQNKISNKKIISTINKRNYENLTEFEPKSQKAERKINYKTPESLQDSLKFEPDLNDLRDDNEFEPNFNTLRALKTNPIIPKGFDPKKYIEYIQDEYINYYIYQ